MYHESSKGLVLIVRDVKVEGGRQRHPSGGVSAKEMVIGLEGVELGADGKVRNQHNINIIIRQHVLQAVYRQESKISFMIQELLFNIL